MTEQYMLICNDCAKKAQLGHLFFSQAWTKGTCEHCGRKMVPRIRVDKGRAETRLRKEVADE